jgi:glutamyl-tRNA synthetase
MTLLTKSRFAPSPTGLLHVGNCRTALLSALFAAHAQGHFLLRIEDTDLARSEDQYVQALMADLRWLGIAWQEGAGATPTEDAQGPYFQSQRQEIYQHYYDALLKQNRAYPCFCSETELAITRKLQLSSGKPPRYAGTCSQLTAEQVAAKQAAGTVANLRFRMQEESIVFTDLVKGEQRYEASDIGDFIIRRADGGATFMFCNAIDDSLMEVSHVIRGEDHLSNTPRQIAILKALQLRTPEYGHISLIFGMDGAPLSKRNGSRSVQELREMGYLPLAIMNYLARLGHYYESNQLMNFAELAASFSSSRLNSSSARFDEQQLLHWQKESMQALLPASLWQLMPEAVHCLVPELQHEAFITLVKPNLVFAHEALHFAEVLFLELHYDENAQAILRPTPKLVFEAALDALQAPLDFLSLLNTVKTTAGVKGQALFQPLRVALTGDLHGPELAGIAGLLGVQTMKKRFEKAMAYCK